MCFYAATNETAYVSYETIFKFIIVYVTHLILTKLRSVSSKIYS